MLDGELTHKDPTQNASVELFNKTYRTEVLDCYVFDSLQKVRDMTTDWLNRYNHHRPHESLGRFPPVEYL
ncbi:integrase core domain-containing protein [Hydrogenophaga sp. PBL-H3]|uniref:integrase core domain-containing protein n=1 Tax=Hydrogenophaga sp. PBL-H3 TaxID=434010 RepID=UPI003FA589DD